MSRIKVRCKLRLYNEALVAAKERSGLTVREICDRIGKKSLSWFFDLQRFRVSKNIDMDAVMRLSVLLGVPVDEILPEDLIGQVICTDFTHTAEVDSKALLNAVGNREARNLLPDPSEELELEDLRRILDRALSDTRLGCRYNTRDRHIIRRYFGLGCKQEDVKQIAKDFGLSISNVNMRINITLSQIRRYGHLVGLTRDLMESDGS